MTKRILVPLVLVAALAGPAAAVADNPPAAKPGKGAIDVDGAIAVRGRLVARADLSGSSSADPVKIRARAGILRVVDLGGDAKVACRGRRSATRTNQQGQKVFLCAGRMLGAAVSGSHVRFMLVGLRFGIQVPDGWAGRLGGNVHPANAQSDQSGSGDQSGSSDDGSDSGSSDSGAPAPTP